MFDSQVSKSALDVWLGHADAMASIRSLEPHARVSLSDYVAVTERIARERSCRSLGWRIGDALSIPHLGDIGTAILAARTLRTAMRRMCAFFELLQDSSQLSLEETEEHCFLIYRILDPDIWPRHQDAIFTLALKSAMLRRLSNVHPKEIELILETDDRQAAADLERETGVTCIAGGEFNAIKFPSRLLDLPVLQDMQAGAPPPDLNSLLVAKRRSASVPDRVRRLVFRDLGAKPISQELVAQELGLSCRTLRRQLAACGFSFQEVLDQCRMRQAVHEMHRGRATPITQLALRLGYSEHSTFSRAFVRWNGVAPLTYLRRHGASGAVGRLPAQG